MPDLSVLIPAIRTPIWKNLFLTLEESCQEYTFELVLVSPFDLPDSLKNEKRIRHIKDYGSPSRAAQIGLNSCRGALVYHTTDDALFYPNAIDNAILLYDETCRRKDVINMRYREGLNWSGGDYPQDYWMAYSHAGMRHPGVRPMWKLAHHHLIATDYMRAIGGYDCSYEYMTHALCDVIFRIQAVGGKIYDSQTHVTTCNQFSGRSIDHAAVHDGQAIDDLLFSERYKAHDYTLKHIKIQLDNWKNSPKIWKRRFMNTMPTTYEELLALNEISKTIAETQDLS